MFLVNKVTIHYFFVRKITNHYFFVTISNKNMTIYNLIVRKNMICNFLQEK